MVTYALLGTMAGVWILQQVVAGVRATVPYAGNEYGLAYWTFIINTDWLWRPWTLVTSTVSHAFGSPNHLLFNGLFLFFFGPAVERLVGAWRMAGLFFLAGALSGVIQVHVSAALGDPNGALGASGALMMLFGLLMLIMPKEKILVWGIVPVPFWAAGIGYAALDIVGALNPHSTVGNFAHLSGMALGLAYGWRLKREWQRNGIRLVRE